MNANLKSVWYGKTKIYPSKIICVGRNYAEHIEQLNNQVPQQMVLFLKPNSAISETLVAATDEPHHFESELCLLVKDQQLVAVAFGFDLTKRAMQNRLKAKGLPWERSKAFDGAALFSHFVPLSGALDELALEMLLNDQVVQRAAVNSMINKPQQILEEIKSFVSLQDGDIIMTGTPKGVGKLTAGSRYVGRVFSNKALLCERKWRCV